MYSGASTHVLDGAWMIEPFESCCHFGVDRSDGVHRLRIKDLVQVRTVVEHTPQPRRRAQISHTVSVLECHVLGLERLEWYE